MRFTDLSDAELLSALDVSCRECRRVDTRIIGLLMEVEDRRLHLAEGFQSIYELCEERYGMSVREAYRRLSAARIATKYPVVLGLLESNALTLTALLALREQLTDENAAELIHDACGKSKRQVQEMLRHNRFAAEQVFGRELIEQEVARSKRPRTPTPLAATRLSSRLSDELRTQLTSGLKNMGFDAQKATPGVDSVALRPAKATDSAATLIVEALAVLCP